MQLSDSYNSFRRFALYEKGLRPRTIREILGIVSKLEHWSGNKIIKSISTTEIRSFLYEQKHYRSWSKKTFCNTRQYLKTFFDFCMAMEYRTDNPVIKIEKPKLPKTLPRCISKAHVQTLLLHLDTIPWHNELSAMRNKAIIRTFLFSGIRLSELLNLQSNHVDLLEETLLVKKGKGEKDRLVPIHPELLPYLKIYSKKKQSTQYYFSSIRSDSRLTQKNLYAIFKRLQKVSGVYVRPHMLRHTFGKLSIEANLNPFTLKSILGHADINTTQIYVSLSGENIKTSFQRTHLL